MNEIEYEELKKKYEEETNKRKFLNFLKQLTAKTDDNSFSNVRVYANEVLLAFSSKNSKYHHRICKALYDEIDKIIKELEEEQK